jgi:ribosomal protein L35
LKNLERVQIKNGMKTNKSFSKRLTVTKKGKILARKKGGNHFNAKESRKTQLARKTKMQIHMTSKAKRRFLAGIN